MTGRRSNQLSYWAIWLIFNLRIKKSAYNLPTIIADIYITILNYIKCFYILRGSGYTTGYNDSIRVYSIISSINYSIICSICSCSHIVILHFLFCVLCYFLCFYYIICFLICQEFFMFFIFEFIFNKYKMLFSEIFSIVIVQCLVL